MASNRVLIIAGAAMAIGILTGCEGGETAPSDTATTATPASFDVEAHEEFCTGLRQVVSSADRMPMSLTTDMLRTVEERQALEDSEKSSLANATIIIVAGAGVADEIPEDLSDELTTLVAAAAETENFMSGDDAFTDATELWESPEVVEALEALDDYMNDISMC